MHIRQPGGVGILTRGGSPVNALVYLAHLDSPSPPSRRRSLLSILPRIIVPYAGYYPALSVPQSRLTILRHCAFSILHCALFFLSAAACKAVLWERSDRKPLSLCTPPPLEGLGKVFPSPPSTLTFFAQKCALYLPIWKKYLIFAP